MTATDAARGDVGRRVGRGALWSVLNNLVLRFGVLLSGVVLARLLSPADYGVYAIALVAMTILMAFNELGVSLALVQWARDPREFAPTAMTISIATSCVLYVVSFLLAPAFCAALGSASAVGVVRVLCIAVVLDGVAVVPAAILNRVFAQRKRLGCDATSFVIGTGTTLLMAAAGDGPMSFAVGRVVGSVASVVMYLILCPVRVAPGWNPSLARELVRFGLPLAGSSLLVLSVTNVDQIIVGAVTDTVALGLYLMAFNVSNWPITVFSEAARRVSLAGFSRLVDDKDALERSLGKGVGLLATAVVPMCVLLVTYARDGLALVYGARWAPAAPILQLLAVLALFRVLLFVAYDLLVALGRSRTLLLLQGGWLALLIPALLVGAHVDGARGAAAAHVLVAALVVTPAAAVLVRRNGVRPWRLVTHCGRPAIGGVLIVVSSVAVHALGAGPAVTVLLGAVAGLLVYGAVAWPMRELMPGRGARGKRHQEVGA